MRANEKYAQNAPTVLIADDSAANVELLRAVLAAEGFRTLTAADGLSAGTLCRAKRPDLVLLDVLMPGESGFETCARLKSDPVTADIPILFLSSLDDVQNKVTGLKIGGVDYISKPVHGEELLARVRVHLRIREVNRRLVDEQRRNLEELRNAQQGILVRPEDCPEATFAVHYKPLEVVGGDFYDVVPIAPGVFSYFVADISGHGVSAGFLTAAVKALLRQYASPVFSPEDVLRGVDSVMRQILGEEQYLTACYARLNRSMNRLSVVSAGHPPLILVSRSGKVQTAEMNSEPLGVFSSALLQRRDLRITEGDRFYMYSDGLIEDGAGGARAAGLQRLVDACVRHRAAPLEQVVSLVDAELRPDQRLAEDDWLLLAVEARP